MFQPRRGRKPPQGQGSPRGQGPNEPPPSSRGPNYPTGTIFPVHWLVPALHKKGVSDPVTALGEGVGLTEGSQNMTVRSADQKRS